MLAGGEEEERGMILPDPKGSWKGSTKWIAEVNGPAVRQDKGMAMPPCCQCSFGARGLHLSPLFLFSRGRSLISPVNQPRTGAASNAISKSRIDLSFLPVGKKSYPNISELFPYFLVSFGLRKLACALKGGSAVPALQDHT